MEPTTGETKEVKEMRDCQNKTGTEEGSNIQTEIKNKHGEKSEHTAAQNNKISCISLQHPQTQDGNMKTAKFAFFIKILLT